MSLIRCRSVIQFINPANARFLYRYHKRRLYPEEIVKWRKKRGLPENPNGYGELTDLPDYTFLDGRRAPPTFGQLRRAVKQRDLGEQIIKFTAEVDQAVELDRKLKSNEADNRQDILKQKLKPKSKSFEASSSGHLGGK